MSTKTEIRTLTKKVEVVEAYCDECGALIERAETLNDGYNSAYYAGEFIVKVDIQTSTPFKGRCKEFVATLCQECTEKAVKKIQDGVTQLFADATDKERRNGTDLEDKKERD